MKRHKRRAMQFGVAILAAGAIGAFSAGSATANHFDPATGGCVPEVPGGEIGAALHDLECLLEETRYIFTHKTT